MGSREGMKLWLNLVCLQNVRRLWWLDSGLE